jgi:hypothetical protein
MQYMQYVKFLQSSCKVHVQFSYEIYRLMKATDSYQHMQYMHTFIAPYMIIFLAKFLQGSCKVLAKIL